MDSASNGKRNSRPKPSFTMNFASQPRHNRFNNMMADNLPPGTIPGQTFLGQFNPYRQGVPSLNFSASDRAVSNQMLQRPQFTSSQTMDSNRMFSQGSMINPPLTPEHLIRTYSQESVGKLKIEPLGEVCFCIFHRFVKLFLLTNNFVFVVYPPH